MDLSRARRALVPPLSYFWIVEWVDGQALAQFDTRTGEEYLFSEVLKRNKQIRRAAWMPFPEPLAVLVERRGQVVSRLPVETLIGIDVPADGEFLLRKRVYMPLGIGQQARGAAKAVHIIGYRRGTEQVLMGVDSYGRRVSRELMDKIGWSIKGISLKGELSYDNSSCS